MKLIGKIVMVVCFAVSMVAQGKDRPEHLKKLDDAGLLAINNPMAFRTHYQVEARFIIGAWCQTLLELLERHSYSMAHMMNEGDVFIPAEAAKEGGQIVKEMESVCGKVDMSNGE